MTSAKQLHNSVSRVPLVLTLGFALILTFSNSLPSSAATTPKIVATLNSPTCPGSAHWHMALLEYFAETNGSILPRDDGQSRLIALGIQPFLDGIAKASDCGVTADIDVWDMDDSIYSIAEDPPYTTQREFLARGYDVVMYRYPHDLGKALKFIGYASSNRWIMFPVLIDWALDTSNGFPHISTLWHEWLHQAVFNIGNRNLDQGLPPNDVHYLAVSNPNRDLASAMQFYSDLTGGKVVISGKYYGFTKEDWIRLGTPTHPKNLIGTVSIYSGWWNAGTGHIALSVENPSFSITLKRKGVGAKTITPSYTYDASGTSINFSLPLDSLWNVCVTTKDSSDRHWAGTKICRDVLFEDVTSKPASTPRAKPNTKEITILCVKGKFSVRVTGVKPKCPKEYIHK